METESLLVGGVRVFFLAVGGDECGVEIDGYWILGADIMVGSVVSGQLPCSDSRHCASCVDRGQCRIGIGSQCLDESGDGGNRRHGSVDAGLVANDVEVGQDITAKDEDGGEVEENLARIMC